MSDFNILNAKLDEILDFSKANYKQLQILYDFISDLEVKL